jgi:hypothetical protein
MAASKARDREEGARDDWQSHGSIALVAVPKMTNQSDTLNKNLSFKMTDNSSHGNHARFKHICIGYVLKSFPLKVGWLRNIGISGKSNGMILSVLVPVHYSVLVAYPVLTYVLPVLFCRYHPEKYDHHVPV